MQIITHTPVFPPPQSSESLINVARPHAGEPERAASLSVVSPLSPSFINIRKYFLPVHHVGSVAVNINITSRSSVYHHRRAKPGGQGGARTIDPYVFFLLLFIIISDNHTEDEFQKPSTRTRDDSQDLVQTIEGLE